MEIDFKTCTVEELWRYVSAHLESRGIDSVLVGGAVVSIYSKGMYTSGDLDFIVRSLNKKELPKALREIGFERTEQRYYAHPECEHLYLEFPTGPIEIADSYDVEPDEKEEGKVRIKILSPTDCVLDRLEQFLIGEYGKPHGERKLFEQAVMVAANQPIKLDRIESYLKQEGRDGVFEEFLEALRQSSKDKI